MSTTTEIPADTEPLLKTLSRPYTAGSFQEKINEFVSMLHELTLQDAEATPEERRHLIAENLHFDQLCTAIRSLFGNEIRSQDIKPIYRKLTTNPDAIIDWTEIFGYLQTEKKENDPSMSSNVIVIDHNSIFATNMKFTMGEAAGDKRRRDTIQCLKIIPSIDSVVAISQKGVITVWNNKLKLSSCKELNEASWSTAITYMSVLRRFVACTERSIHFFDHRATGKQQSIFNLKPFSHAPLCVTWVPFSSSSLDDTLVFGDNEGYLNFVRVNNKDLTPRQPKGIKRTAVLSFTIDPSELTEPVIRRRFHDDWVTQVEYLPDLKCIGSCSPSQQFAFCLEPVERIWDGGDIRPVTVLKGVNSFTYCLRANVIVTGGVDKILRVWHPHIWTRPTGKLVGHLFTICQIVSNEADQHIISLSTARIFRVWDLQNLVCLQIFSDSDERPGERRIFSIGFDHLNDRLITGSSVIESWPLTRSVQDTMLTPQSHDRQIVQIISNRAHNHLISICSESVIKMWEVENGKLISSISEPHGIGVEITASSLEDKGFRLATGAIDGSIKVWDLGSGEDVKSRPCESSAFDIPIIGINYILMTNQRCLIVSEAFSCPKIYLDSDSGHELQFLSILIDSFSRPYIPTSEQLQVYPIIPQITDPVSLPTPTNSTLLAMKVNEVKTDIKTKVDAILTNDETRCQDFNQETGVLVTGTSDGKVLLWDLNEETGSKFFNCHHYVDPSHVRSEDPPPIYTVNAILILVHKSDIDDSVKKPDDEETKENENKNRRSSHNSKRYSKISHTDTRSSNPNCASPVIKPSEEITENNVVEHTERDTNGKLFTTPPSENSPEEFAFLQEEKVEQPRVMRTYPSVVVSAHSDGRLRFWRVDDGALLANIKPDFRPSDHPLTALAADTDHNLLLVGNSRGYLCLIEVGPFLRSPSTVQKPLQLVTWRAHSNCVVSLCYVLHTKSFASSSHDASIRLYWGKAGRYYGYFGQARSFKVPKRELSPGSRPLLPPDVLEKPTIADQRSTSARQKERATRNMDYPLCFSENRWDPFSRTQFLKDIGTPRSTTKSIETSLEKKFFRAVSKPRAYNDHLESSISGDKSQGAVFRSLPVYRVGTPCDIRPPQDLLIADLGKTSQMKKSPWKSKKTTQASSIISTNVSRRSSITTIQSKSHR